MAINRKVRTVNYTMLAIFILLTIVLLLCSCTVEEIPNVTQLKRVIINNSEVVKVKGDGGGQGFYFIKFEYEGHEYFGDPLSGNSFMMHSPNCPCQTQKETSSSSLGSSLFDSSLNW